MMLFDPLFLLFMIPTTILGFIAQRMVTSRFNKYAQVSTHRGLTGAQAARQILDANGLHDVRVEESQGGQLSDHYDPRDLVLRLSPDVARRSSVASVGVAAHEAGHAIQHAKGYFPLQVRSALVPAVNFGNSLAPIIIIAGIMLQVALGLTALGTAIAWIGVLGYAMVVLFSLVTLPVELDASSRAKELLYQHNVVDKGELKGVTAVLNAAAWTYVVAALAALMQLLYWVSVLFRSR